MQLYLSLLWQSRKEIAGALREISKSSPATGYLPNDRGISNVKPLFKNGSREY